jgi:hypothetical protein
LEGGTKGRMLQLIVKAHSDLINAEGIVSYPKASIS